MTAAARIASSAPPNKAESSLARRTFTISRELEYFTERELTAQIGYERRRWPLVLIKELVDNGLDACESAGLTPEITIRVAPDWFSVEDNGPGLPAETIQRSLDYNVRVSDKTLYVSPTRGQQGNALKTVWAAPFVIDGERGRVGIHAGDTIHIIRVSLDRIAQKPRIRHITRSATVKNGTKIKVAWPGIASEIGCSDLGSSYDRMTVGDLVRAFAAVNPHATFLLINDDGTERFEATTPDWRKWLPTDPTPPHWYGKDQIASLIAGIINDDQGGEKQTTVRQFLAGFAGLTGTRKQAAVAATADAPTFLSEYAFDDDLDRVSIGELLNAMKLASRPIKPKALGRVDLNHIFVALERMHADPDTIRTKRVESYANDLPFIVEAGFGILSSDYGSLGRQAVTALNWSPTVRRPNEIEVKLNDHSVDDFDPVAIIIHLICPRFDFRDRGKTEIAVPGEMRVAIHTAIKSITTGWRSLKKRKDRKERVNKREIEEARQRARPTCLNLKQAVRAALPEAYSRASDGGTLPANARQLMYACRPEVLKLTGGRLWKNTSYFTQTLLPEFVEAYPEIAGGWDVVFDDRGHLVEPHTRTTLGIGTVAVRKYVNGWSRRVIASAPRFGLQKMTSGPANRYGAALFIEKEGFDALIDRSGLRERFDIAVLSTKGMSVTAARRLIERLSDQGVTIFALHDFDAAGIVIESTLRTDTRRYQFQNTPNVIDLGLRLDDVQRYGLESEPVFYDQGKDPRENLKNHGASPAECEFLVEGRERSGWRGQRVELNAMTSRQLLEHIEAGLTLHGVEKVVPDADDLGAAWRSTVRLERANLILGKMDHATADPPADLEQQIRKRIEGTADAWDSALHGLAVEFAGNEDEAAS